MATFTGTGSHNSNYTGTLTVTEQSYDIASNSSVVAYSLVLTGNSGYYFQQTWVTTKVYVNGQVQDRYEQISMPSPSGGVSNYTICSGTTTVPHNNDGTKTITVYATISTPTTQTYLPGTVNVPSGLNGSLTLTTIPRASTMTVPSLTIGSAGTFTISAASNAFTHTITYSFQGLTGTAATLNAGVSTASWTPPNTFYAKLPNSVSGTVSYVLHTYSGGTEVGSVSYTGTVSVGSTIKPTAPTVTLSPVNSNAWFNARGLYVGGYSAVRVQSSATAGTGASMSSYTISGSISGSGADYTSGILPYGQKTITVTATDSRGRTNSSSTTVNFISYSNPSITTFTAERGTYAGGTWTSNVNGDHIRVTAIGTVSLSANGNAGTITVKIGGTSPSATSGNYYYFTHTLATSAYAITGTITDSVGYSSSRGLTVPAIEVPFNINVDLPGVGVGMIAQTSRNLEIGPDWHLVANGKFNVMNYGPYSFNARGTMGSSGYARIATITVTGYNLSAPLEFKCARRFDNSHFTISIRFTDTGSSLDPNIESFTCDWWTGTVNPVQGIFAVKVTTSVWDIYVLKNTAYDEIEVIATVPNIDQRACNVTFADAGQASKPNNAIDCSMPIQMPVFFKFSVAAGATVRISFTSEVSMVLSCTGWDVNLRSGMWHIAGYADSSRADVTALKSASGITITGVSGLLAWDIKNTRSVAALFGVLVMYGGTPTLS